MNDPSANLEQGSAKFYGLYPGQVEKNSGDPQRNVVGRLLVRVPQVFGAGVGRWALPCAPFAGKQQGFFALPDEGTVVWVMFEAGDPSYPVWMGATWGESGLTAADAKASVKMIKTSKFTLRIDDGKSELKIEDKNGNKITLDPTGMKLEGAVVTCKTPSGRQVRLDAVAVDVNLGGMKVL